jgi:hypothetical protein
VRFKSNTPCAILQRFIWEILQGETGSAGIDIAALPVTAPAAAATYAASRGHHVNTYTWSKNIGEHAVTAHARARGTPLCIVRPSIIGPAWSVPHTGWATSASPAIGGCLLFGSGVLRACFVEGVRQNVIPVDWVARDVLQCVTAHSGRDQVEGAPRFVHSVVAYEDENSDHEHTLAVTCEV